MTPLQIFDYKQNWRPGYSVRLHSDLESQGKDWCKKELDKHQWNLVTWTHIYEHTFQFEDEENAQRFKQTFSEYADQLQI